MPDNASPRILIVDDEAELVKVLCNTLRVHGYDTVGFVSSQSALVAMEVTEFDLILTDLMMPGMDGIAFLGAARKFDPDLVGILMTGSGTIATAVEAMRAGALDYILKPFELSVILPVISRSLKMRQLRRENLALAQSVRERTAELETANQALRTSEAELRTLAHWVVQTQEEERAGLSVALHDNITQLLCAIQVRTLTLGAQLPTRNGPAKKEAIKLREMLGNAADEVESISRNLRPGVLDLLGLAAVLNEAGAEFTGRTGVSVTVDCVSLPSRLPAEVELALYRVLQIALINVEQHAHAHCVAVSLEQASDFIRFTIKDDGVGFESGAPADREGTGGVGLLRMRERATYAGGVLKVKSAQNAGTEIEVRIPLPHFP